MYGMYLRDKLGDQQPEFEQVRADLDNMLEQARRRLTKRGSAPSAFEEARFAVAAFLDEAINLSNWDGRDQWTGRTLQRRYYNTSRAGEEFFEHLEKLPPDADELRELYLTCLALGFRGRYFHPDQDAQLEEIIDRHSALMWRRRSSGGTVEDLAFPQAYPGRREHPGRAWDPDRNRPFWVFLILIPPGAVVTMYALYRLFLNVRVYDWFHQLI
jgi:type VI secretion system protein ImpK